MVCCANYWRRHAIDAPGRVGTQLQKILFFLSVSEIVIILIVSFFSCLSSFCVSPRETRFFFFFFFFSSFFVDCVFSATQFDPFGKTLQFDILELYYIRSLSTFCVVKIIGNRVYTMRSACVKSSNKIVKSFFFFFFFSQIHTPHKLTLYVLFRRAL